LAPTLVADLPEPGTIDRLPIAKRIGAAPLNQDRRRRQGERSVRGGRAAASGVLYLTTLVATCLNPGIRDLCPPRSAAGEARQLALTRGRRT